MRTKSPRFLVLGACWTLLAGASLGCRNGREHALGSSGTDVEAGSSENSPDGSSGGSEPWDSSTQIRSDATLGVGDTGGDMVSGPTDGAMMGKPAIGAGCNAGADCASSFCVDGVCCETMCTGSCDTCNGTTPGHCTPVTGTPPNAHTPCPAITGSVPSCSAGKCDFTCTATYQRCGNQCVAPGQPCNNQCPGSQRLCGTMCVQAQCCGNSDCGVCQECVGGACQNQGAGQDKKSECSGRGCNAGTCRVCSPAAPAMCDGASTSRRCNADGSQLVPTDCGARGCDPSAGTCCPSGQQLCSAGCTSVSSDPGNCGSCGHDCLGGTCVNGACQAKMVATGFSGANLAVTTSDVYVVDYGSGGRLLRISKASGSITPVAFGNVGGVAAFGGKVYWSLVVTLGGTDGKVIRAAPDGSGQETIAMQQATPLDVVADSSGVYWLNGGTTDSDGSIMSLPSGSTMAVPVATSQAGPSSLAIDSANVYWFTVGAANDGSQGTVFKRSKAGGSISPIAQNQPNATGSAFSLSARGGRVYFAPRGLGNTDGLVRSVSTNGGAIADFATNQVRPQAVDADDSFVYWTSYGNGNDGLVQRASLATKEINQLVGALAGPLDLKVDGLAIYFTTAGSGATSGALFRLAR